VIYTRTYLNPIGEATNDRDRRTPSRLVELSPRRPLRLLPHAQAVPFSLTPRLCWATSTYLNPVREATYDRDRRTLIDRSVVAETTVSCHFPMPKQCRLILHQYHEPTLAAYLCPISKAARRLKQENSYRP
jgi:hypothetical protein